jgi:hypothetical protein
MTIRRDKVTAGHGGVTVGRDHGESVTTIVTTDPTISRPTTITVTNESFNKGTAFRHLMSICRDHGPDIVTGCRVHGDNLWGDAVWHDKVTARLDIVPVARDHGTICHDKR